MWASRSLQNIWWDAKAPGRQPQGHYPSVCTSLSVSSESTKEGETQIWKGASDPGYTTETLWLTKANSLGLGLPLLPDTALISRSQICTFTLAFCGNAPFFWGGCRQHASLCRVKFGKCTVFLWFLKPHSIRAVYSAHIYLVPNMNPPHPTPPHCEAVSCH